MRIFCMGRNESADPDTGFAQFMIDSQETVPAESGISLRIKVMAEQQALFVNTEIQQFLYLLKGFGTGIEFYFDAIGVFQKYCILFRPE